MANNRIFYAVQQVGLKPDGGDYHADAFRALHGVQSVGMTTNFNLSQVFELGQISIYENIEDIPDVEISMTKVLDGSPLIYHEATRTASSPTLSGRQNEKSIFALGIWPDTEDACTSGKQVESQCECSGLFVSSIAYNFPLEDSFTEDITLVGNHKVWHADSRIIAGGATVNAYGIPDADFVGAFTAAGASPSGNGGVNRREDLIFGPSGVAVAALGGNGVDSNGYHRDSDVSCLPNYIPGINTDGTNTKDSDGNFGAHISNISCSTDLGREEIFELGRKAPYHRFASFPTEVTCEIEITATSGDLISATEEGILSGVGGDQCLSDSGNLSDATIRLATCEGTRIYLGKKNKLASVNYGGGDAGGGNATVTYSFTTFNDMTVMHINDQNPNFTWAARATHLAPA